MTAVFDNPALRAELSRDEGRRPMIYKDSVGLITGGVGRCLSMVPFSDDEIDLMLSNDIDRAADRLDAGAPWWRKLDPVRRRVMLNMCFNMGWGDGSHGLSAFKNTLAAIQGARWDEAAMGMLNSAWARQVGARAQRLAAMMRVGSP